MSEDEKWSERDARTAVGGNRTHPMIEKAKADVDQTLNSLLNSCLL